MPALPFSIITPIWPWEQFQALIHSESTRWQKLIKDLNITLD